jgi:hypothetical protein
MIVWIHDMNWLMMRKQVLFRFRPSSTPHLSNDSKMGPEERKIKYEFAYAA